MAERNVATVDPTDGIWKRFLLLIPLALALALCSYLYARPKMSTYTAQTFYPYSEDELSASNVEFSDPGVAQVLSVETTPGSEAIVFGPLANGHTYASIHAGDRQETWSLEVHDGIITEHGVNFDGWEAVALSLYVFLGALALLFASCLVKLWRTSWYGYTMVACGGGFLFCLFQLLFFAAAGLLSNYPAFRYFLSDVSNIVSFFSASSIFVVVPLALLVSLSNISLIRHEGLRPVNLLGIAASVVWTLAYVLWVFLNPAQPSFLMELLGKLIPLAIAYGECLLFSTIMCAFIASRHVPKRPMDYLVILGCGIRDDGTPCPLLAGRVDKALSFDQSRIALGDAPATFVPSGGQGDDEPISEAQSMGNYLEEKGVEHERIVLENRSTTTRENMAFSREVIERHAGRSTDELLVGFSTTNYHVFRGYVCAHEAGMAVEGMGAKTKYYFWPNAFLREFVGLLAARWQTVLLGFLLSSASYFLVVSLLTIASE